MRTLFILFLFISIGAKAQTTTTLAKLDAMTTTPSSSTVYRVIKAVGDTVLYQADYLCTAAEDGDKVIVTPKGVHFVKLAKLVCASIPPPPPPSTAITAAQVSKIVSDSLKSYYAALAKQSATLADSVTSIKAWSLQQIKASTDTLWFDGKYFEGGTKTSPMRPRQ